VGSQLHDGSLLGIAVVGWLVVQGAEGGGVGVKLGQVAVLLLGRMTVVELPCPVLVSHGGFRRHCLSRCRHGASGLELRFLQNS